ncbi:MAG: hypothetical protein ACYCW6_28500 [Candidatus Xenobia bacterium]
MPPISGSEQDQDPSQPWIATSWFRYAVTGPAAARLIHTAPRPVWS